MYNKLEKQKPPRMTNNEALGHIMIDAGNDYGPGTSYGEWSPYIHLECG